jgi:MOSC domain-containing protein YiiM
MTASVSAVCRSGEHSFSKAVVTYIRLLEGLGVENDAHQGRTVKHRSRVAKDPTQPNLRQVHLIHRELLDELAGKGFAVLPGEMGENITTQGIDLLGLPIGARLAIGAEAVVEVTGLRNPCGQIETFRNGLLSAVLDRDGSGAIVRKAGVMGIVVAGGIVRAGDGIGISLPEPPHRRLEVV